MALGSLSASLVRDSVELLAERGPALGLWVPKTCATWPDALLTAGCLAPRLPGRGMIFGLWA
jgi:hypothetical protein